MKRSNPSIWVLSVAIVASSSVFIDRPLQDQLTQAEEEHDHIIAETDRNVAIAHDAAALAHQLASLRAEMATVDLSDDSVRLVATFVGEATAVARACHVRITGFDGRPLTRAASIPIDKTSTEHSAFSATAIELTLQGTYANVIRSLRRLSHERVPVHVEVVAIDRTADPRNDREPLLDTHVRVDILHRSNPKVADAAPS